MTCAALAVVEPRRQRRRAPAPPPTCAGARRRAGRRRARRAGAPARPWPTCRSAARQPRRRLRARWGAGDGRRQIPHARPAATSTTMLRVPWRAAASRLPAAGAPSDRCRSRGEAPLPRRPGGRPPGYGRHRPPRVRRRRRPAPRSSPAFVRRRLRALQVGRWTTLRPRRPRRGLVRTQPSDLLRRCRSTPWCTPGGAAPLLAVVGPDQVVLGSDHPLRSATPTRSAP